MLKSKTGMLAMIVAALCLITSNVQASIQGLYVDHYASSLTLSGNIDASSVGGPGYANLPYTAQGVGSMTAAWTGLINIDLQPGTIQLMPGSTIIGLPTGYWAPAPGPGPGNPDPVGGFGNSGTTEAIFGVNIVQLGLQAAFKNLRLDFGVPAQPAIPLGIPSTPLALAGNNFNLTGQGMAFTQGRQLLVSGLGNDNANVAGFPTVFSTGSGNPGGPYGADVGTWDGTTLTIPVHSSVTYLANASPAIYSTFQLTGVIVARVPEPSTIIMAGLGVVGLVAAGYRSRKRKA